jgi:translation initiation factor 1 (eIF-1/SUI1)
LRNHPFPPTAEDIDRIQLQMGDHRETILEELKKRGVAAKPASG